MCEICSNLCCMQLMSQRKNRFRFISISIPIWSFVTIRLRVVYLTLDQTTSDLNDQKSCYSNVWILWTLRLNTNADSFHSWLLLSLNYLMQMWDKTIDITCDWVESAKMEPKLDLELSSKRTLIWKMSKKAEIVIFVANNKSNENKVQ